MSLPFTSGMNVVAQEVHMSEEDLEVLITLDDPGEEDLEDDTFHDRQADKTRSPQTLDERARAGARR